MLSLYILDCVSILRCFVESCVIVLVPHLPLTFLADWNLSLFLVIYLLVDLLVLEIPTCHQVLSVCCCYAEFFVWYLMNVCLVFCWVVYLLSLRSNVWWFIFLVCGAMAKWFIPQCSISVRSLKMLSLWDFVFCLFVFLYGLMSLYLMNEIQ